MKFAIVAACVFACALAGKVTPKQWDCSMSAEMEVPTHDPLVPYEHRTLVGMINGKDRYLYTVALYSGINGYSYERSDVKDYQGKCIKVFIIGRRCQETFVDCDSIDYPVFEPFSYDTEVTVPCPLSPKMNCTQYNRADNTTIVLNSDGYVVKDADDVRYLYKGKADPNIFEVDRCNQHGRLPAPENPCGGY